MINKIHIMNHDSSVMRTVFLNMAVTLVLVSLFVIPECSFAKDLFTLSGEYSSTSDDIDLYTLHYSYINNRRKYYWPYEESPSSSTDVGMELNRYSGQTDGTRFVGWKGQQMIGGRISPAIYIKGGLGLHLLDVKGPVDDKSIITYDVGVWVDPIENLSINLNANKDYVYQLGVQPAGVRQLLYANQWEGRLEWYPVETVRVIASDSTWILSDDNHRRESKFNILYGISPYSPWIWVGIFHEKLNFDEKQLGYWSPQKFTADGLMWESTFSINEKWTGTVAATISKIKEDEFPRGDGNSILVGFDYKLISEKVLRVGFRRINSSQGESNWDERAFNVSINGSF